ncbi:hypothetical protein C4J83_5321 [Pseudomonas sp. LBUM920]|nr:hypothetical protein C4J83_5321 [Pseudomonas sp. LBUM920]
MPSCGGIGRLRLCLVLRGVDAVFEAFFTAVGQAGEYLDLFDR